MHTWMDSDDTLRTDPRPPDDARDPRPAPPLCYAQNVNRPLNDTHPDIEAMRIEAYRRMTPTQKLEIVCALNRAVRELALADIRQRHPHADEHELLLRLASRSLPPDLLLKAFGWDVTREGY